MKKVPKGTATPDSTVAIVEREFELRSDGGESKVFARLRRPVPEQETTFRCEVEIEGLGDPILTRAVGVDAIQSYELALQAVALRLLSSPLYQSGRLTFRGAYDLRLPVPESYSYLVRTDLERDRAVLEMAGKDEASKRFREESISRLQDKSKVWPDQPEDAPIVLERVFDLRRGRKRTDVRVFFRKPVPDRLGHWCAFKIEGLLKKPHARTRMLGDDPVESLRNAMRLAMVYIVSSPAYQRGQLTWLGMYDLGMPIVEDVEPLIRKDLHAKVMAELLMNPSSLPRKAPKAAR
jgi:hypothetical protein